MYYSIFRNNILVADVEPLDTSELVQKKQTEDFIRLNFTLEDPIDFEIGDYIVYAQTAQRYKLNQRPRLTEEGGQYTYECHFESIIHDLQKTKVFLRTNKEDGTYYQDFTFPLTGNAETFLYFIVENLNRNGYNNITSGKFKSTETVTIDFNNFNVFEAILTISEKLNFDWYIDDTTLNFDAKDIDKGYVLQVGPQTGLEKLTRIRVENEKIETVVFGYGSTENLPSRETFDSELLTINRLSFEGVGGLSKLENNTDKFGSIESIQVFDDIKPEFTGNVSSVDTENHRIFYDDSINFDINDQLLSGINPKVTFLTGKLIGFTFNIAYTHDENKIVLDYYTEESGQYPNDFAKPEIGDKYKLHDIAMPDIYITDAQTRLQSATQEYLDRQSNYLEYFEAPVSSDYVESENITLSLGDIVRIVSTVFQIDNNYEIKELTQKITEPYKYTVKFGDVIQEGLITTVKYANFATEQSIYNIEKNSITNNEVTNITNENKVEWQQL